MRNLNNTLNELSKKVEECNLNLRDMEQFKRRLTAENSDLLRQLQELENNANKNMEHEVEMFRLKLQARLREQLKLMQIERSKGKLQTDVMSLHFLIVYGIHF